MHKSLRSICASALVALPLAMAAPAAAVVPPTSCSGSVVGLTGPVTVVAGAQCSINADDHVTSVTVAPGGSVEVSNTTVFSVVSQGFTRVYNTHVTGRLTLSGGPGGRICGSTVDGPTVIQANTDVMLVGPLVCTGGTLFHGSVKLLGNLGSVVLDANRIEGALVCRANKPPPTGTNLELPGGATGQCAGFVS